MDIYIARQPIFSNSRQLCGYELLYRDSELNAYNPSVDGNQATGTVISEALLNFGLDSLTGGKQAYVNFTEDLLLERSAVFLDPDQFIVEILENVNFTEEVLNVMGELKKSGFTLALDDYTGQRLDENVVKYIDLFKLDFRDTTREVRKNVASSLKRAKKKILAEKIETEEDFNEGIRIGCELFQGYYFAKPTVLKKGNRDIASATYIKLVQMMTSPDLDMNELSDVIQADAHLTYKLLKKMRSVQYYRGQVVTDIKHALVRMGMIETRRWIMLVLMRSVTNTNTDELMRTALIRAVFCEKIAKSIGGRQYTAEAFNTGMFSILDKEDPEFLQLMEEMRLPDSIRQALEGEDNLPGFILKVALSYENGRWEELASLMEEQKVENLVQMYLDAAAYADDTLAKEK